MNMKIKQQTINNALKDLLYDSKQSNYGYFKFYI